MDLSLLSEQIGLPETALRYIFGMFAAFPFAYIHRYILWSAEIRHYFSAAVGFLVAWFVFEVSSLNFFAAALGTYFICMTTPRRRCHLFAFIWNIFYLSLGFISSPHSYLLCSLLTFSMRHTLKQRAHTHTVLTYRHRYIGEVR